MIILCGIFYLLVQLSISTSITTVPITTTVCTIISTCFLIYPIDNAVYH